MAAKRRKRADAVPEERAAPRHLCHSVFGFFCFSSSSSSWSSGNRGPSLDALHWAPATFQPLAALEAGAGWTHAGGVICGGAGDGDLAGAVSSCRHRSITLQTPNTHQVITHTPSTSTRLKQSRTEGGFRVKFQLWAKVGWYLDRYH